MEAENCAELTDLIGLPASHASISRFLKNLGARPGLSEKQCFPALKSRPPCEYHNYKAIGISLCFEDDALQAFHLYNQGHGYSSYKGALPFHLRMEMSAKDVVQMLGEPEGKVGGGRACPISLHYKDKGLQVNLRNNDWEDPSNPVESVTVHKPQAARLVQHSD